MGGEIERGAARYGNFEDKFRTWAKDMSEDACRDVHIAGPPDSPFEITEEQFQKWLKLATESIEHAGSRLATVLYAILEHKRSSEHVKYGRGFRHDHARWRRGCTTNLFIAVILVPALILSFSWHEREGFKIKL